MIGFSVVEFSSMGLEPKMDCSIVNGKGSSKEKVYMWEFCCVTRQTNQSCCCPRGDQISGGQSDVGTTRLNVLAHNTVSTTMKMWNCRPQNRASDGQRKSLSPKHRKKHSIQLITEYILQHHALVIAFKAHLGQDVCRNNPWGKLSRQTIPEMLHRQKCSVGCARCCCVYGT